MLDLVTLVLSTALASQEARKLTHDVAVDSASLATDVFLPPAGARFPTVLVRTPYDKDGVAWLAEALTPRGYAVVTQDVRGMVASTGEFHPILNEEKDGLATLDWVAKQPWCDGNIGMWGSSYVGYCGLIVAASGHPNLKAIFQLSGWADSRELFAPGGALHLMFALRWSLTGQIHGTSIRADWPKLLAGIPVAGIPESNRIDSPVWRHLIDDWVRSSAAKGTLEGRFQRVKIPVLHLSGWNDFCARHTIDTYERLGSVQRLVVGPWGHDGYWSSREARVGDDRYGPESALGFDEVGEMTAEWFDRWLKGREHVDGAPVELFVMGANEWREYERWPPEATRQERWYLDSLGDAATLEGDGFLTREPPDEALSDVFEYDPADPTPTVGGVNFHHFVDNLGPKDQREVEQRGDVLVYTSTPLEEPIEILGPLSAVVFAESEAPRTDFTAKLVIVREDGYARIVEDGIKRGADSGETGDVRRYTIDLGDTAIQVRKGERLRVEISSSNFPKYTRASNTAELPELAKSLEAAIQTVHHSPDHRSHVLLHVAR